jgi:hypothetical protein
VKKRKNDHGEYVFREEEMQKLIDLIFELCYVSGEFYQDKNHNALRERHMEWVASHLRVYGFDTIPMGMSWGALR